MICGLDVNEGGLHINTVYTHYVIIILHIPIYKLIYTYNLLQIIHLVLCLFRITSLP